MRHDRVDADNESVLSDETMRDELGDTAGSGHHGYSPLSAEHHDEPLPPPPPTKPNPNPNAPVAWRELPRKDQLFIITLARMSEPLAYMYYQLKSFSPSLPPSAIAAQAGIIYASFTAAQFLTAMLWGRVADSPRAGRKSVLLIGLCGTALSCLGFGFSTSFAQALVFRTMGGMTNGNVGVMRTMISEIIREKRFQSRAFLLLPMTFNCGVIVGPIMGGLLSDPASSYPSSPLFGSSPFFQAFPYALPNLVSAVFLLGAATLLWLGLEETHDALHGQPDLGSRLGKRLVAAVRSKLLNHPPGTAYTLLPTSDVDPMPIAKPPARRYTQRLPFRRIFTPNVLATLSASFLMGIHLGSFQSLWFVFLSTPSWDPSSPSSPPRRLPFFFTGGLGLPPRSVGLAMAVLGLLGITLQFLLYPRLSARLGNLLSWRLAQCCFPLAYLLLPFLSVVPTTPSSPPPGPKGGPAIWLSIVCVLAIQVLGRTFAIPSQTILVNNASPHPSVLGSVHGLGQSVNSAARTLGPVVGGVVYGFGLDRGMVGLAWWILSCVAVCAVVASLFVREGDGHEIWLEGDEDDSVQAGP